MKTTTDNKQQLYNQEAIIKAVFEKHFDKETVAVRNQIVKALENEIEKSGVGEVVNGVLLALIWSIDKKEKTEEDNQVSAAIGVLYTMIEEGRIKEVNEAFVQQFPEYYTFLD